MPIIEIKILEGRTIEQKRRIAIGFTEVCVKELGIGAEHVDIHFVTMRREDYAVAGTLFIDK